MPGKYYQGGKMMKGKIHSIDTFSTLDGPGIRTIIFLQGCHLKCKYCQNPDTWDLKSKAAAEYSVDEIMEVISRGKPYFEASGGGITFSGGEPLLQHQFVKEVFGRCRQENISTAFDSSLYVSHGRVAALLPFTDLVLADIKHIRTEKSFLLTGQGNELNLSNLLLIDSCNIPIWIRYVVVPGWTDDIKDIKALAEFTAGLDSVKRIDLLPYHSLGAHKWKLSGLSYELLNTPAPSSQFLQEAKSLLQSISGKPVIIPR